MAETKKAREEREAQEAALAGSQTVEPLELKEQGFDVTQPPPSDLDGKSVDYSKTTMPVVNDPQKPASFNPQSNR